MIKAPENFLFIATGGTIEFVPGASEMVKVDDVEMTYQPPNFRDKSVIPQHLQRFHSDLQYDFVQVCMKDAKDVKLAELLQVQKAIMFSDAENIIVTHGTDKMVENAKLLKKWDFVGDKKLIFVGAFRPLEGGDSDGVKNIATAVEQAANLTGGIYISANGKIYDCEEIVKDYERNEFVSR